MRLCFPVCLSDVFIHLNRVTGFHKSRDNHYDVLRAHPDILKFNFHGQQQHHGKNANDFGVSNNYLLVHEFCVVVDRAEMRSYVRNMRNTATDCVGKLQGLFFTPGAMLQKLYE